MTSTCINFLITWDIGDCWKPNAIGNHSHGPAVHEIIFRLWITPIVAWPAETTHPALDKKITVHSWSGWNKLICSRCCKSYHVSRAGISHCLLTNYYGPCIWRGIKSEFFGRIILRLRAVGILGQAACSIFYFCVTHLGALVYLTNVLFYSVFIVSEHVQGSCVKSELSALFERVRRRRQLWPHSSLHKLVAGHKKEHD